MHTKHSRLKKMLKARNFLLVIKIYWQKVKASLLLHQDKREAYVFSTLSIAAPVNVLQIMWQAYFSLMAAILNSHLFWFYAHYIQKKLPLSSVELSSTLCAYSCTPKAKLHVPLKQGLHLFISPL